MWQWDAGTVTTVEIRPNWAPADSVHFQLLKSRKKKVTRSNGSGTSKYFWRFNRPSF